MAKVTMREPGTPKPAGAETAVAGEVVVTDAKGRRLTLKKPALLAEFRIMEAVGPQVAANPTYMQMLMPLLYLSEIDGESIELPKTKREAEALIQLAGHDGYTAVMVGVAKHFKDANPDLEELVKNGGGTLG